MIRMAWRLRRAAIRLQGERIELRQLLDAHGPGGQGGLLMLLAAACLLPVPGVAAVLGLGIAGMAWAMWRGTDVPCLPEPLVRQTLPRLWARRVLALLARVHEMAARLARPRLPIVFKVGSPSWWLPWLVAWMAVLIVLPVPFGNVLPALALMLLGTGLVFLDGWLVVVAWAAAALATAFPVALVVAAAAWWPASLGAWVGAG
jgi:hypothetical protein